jgi:hypothetical protein
MTKIDKELYREIESLIDSYQQENGNTLVGINNSIVKDVLIKQMVDSVKRIKYINVVQNRDISEERTNPHSPLFDPIKAAIWHNRSGNTNEALWIVFLLTHFGESYTHGWNYTKAVYGKLNSSPYWSWDNIKYNIRDFIDWLDENYLIIKPLGKFGNHRKYQSLSATSSKGTGATISSYRNLFGDSPKNYIDAINEDIKTNPKGFFDYLYKQIRGIVGFGRLARFDFLTMIGKMSIYSIEPGNPYLTGASGPKFGAQKLYEILDARQLNSYLTDLGNYLNFPFVMQILEDSLCNWQKGYLLLHRI